MTQSEKKNAIKCIKTQLENGYIDVGGVNYKNEVEVIRQAIYFMEYFDELYSEGLEIANWHQNGDLEPFDNFYESALQSGD